MNSPIAGCPALTVGGRKHSAVAVGGRQSTVRPERASRQRTARPQRGSMLALYVTIGAIIFVPVAAFLVFTTLHLLHRERAESVVQAAVKVAAIDLSRIVVKDDHFGYISLSNYPAVGKRTQSKDGEPLPVVSLHQWQKAVSQAKRVSSNLHNETIASCAEEDQSELNTAISAVDRQIELALDGDPRAGCVDINGKRVEPLSDVQNFLQQNLPSNVQLISTQLTAGYANDDADTLDPQAHLVSPTIFADADGNHISSLVKLQCTFKTTEQTGALITTTAYCQAYSEPDRTTPGAMNVRFPGRPVLGLLTWNEFLTDRNFNDNKLINFEATNGDFPMDKDSRLQQTTLDTTPTATAHDFARHLYYWLRSAHGRLKDDALTAVMTDPFLPYQNQAYTYNVTADGGITRTTKQGQPGTVAIAADGEHVSMADTRIRSGASVVVLFHDNVENLDADSAKHGGYPYQDLALDIEIGGTGDSTAKQDMIAARDRTRHRRV